MMQINQFLIWYGGWILFIAVFAEQSGIPIPAAPFLLTAGALAASGKLSLIPAVAGATVACVLADVLWFYAGRRGKARFSQLFGRWSGVGHERRRNSNAMAAFRGVLAIAVAKFLPLGSLVPLRAGTLGIGLLWFLLLDLPVSLIYGSAYLALGFLFHRQMSQLMAISGKLGAVGALLALLLLVVYTAFWLLRRYVFTRNPINDSPAIISDLGPQVPGAAERLMSQARIEQTT